MLTVMLGSLSSCITIVDQGPRGDAGKVYFGIDYDYSPPYSYWDDNYNVPQNPYFGELYRTEAGIYNFEYFINPYEYWYGTYRLYRNLGEPGGDYGVRGADGADTFFLLICNDDGFYAEEWEECGCVRTQQADGSITIEGNNKSTGQFKVSMKKANVNERASKNTPKFKRD